MIARNEYVCEFRKSIIDQIFEAVKKEQGMQLSERLDAYKSVTYNDMLYSVKPLKVESFYKDLSFLQ